jgi:HAD superfamily hydrolase (TIGR01549 family)
LIKGIIFDLGSTLIYMSRNWDEVFREGAEAMSSWYLKKKHVKLNAEALIAAFMAEWAEGRGIAEQTQTEILAETYLHNALKKIEAPASAGAFVEAAIKIYFESEEKAWQSYPDAVDTLKLLKARGYRLGLYSNAADDKCVQRLINLNKFRPFLAPTFSSAGWGWRKPRREGFDLIAKRWDLPPEQIVVIGDTLNADILGAQNAGMAGILVTMHEALSNQHHRHIQPTAVAGSLAEIPGLVEQL